MEKIHHANNNQRRVKWLYYYQKKDFNIKIVTERKKGHRIMTKRSMYQENIAIINTYAPNNRASKDIKKK